MLRELQKLLASERIIREQLEQQVGPKSHDMLPSNMVSDVINMAAEHTEHVDIPLHILLKFCTEIFHYKNIRQSP